MSEKSLYDILGLSSNASSAEIKAAFRKMAKKFHPDVNTSHNAGEFFKLINSAYETLRNEEKKAVYDKIIFNSKQPFKGENKKSSDAQRAAETKARQEQEAAQRAAETKARQEQEAAQRAAETKARQEQEAAQRAAETKARQEQEAAQRAAETKARQEQEAAQRAAETKARQEQEAAQRAAETKARQEQEAAQRAAELLLESKNQEFSLNFKFFKFTVSKIDRGDKPSTNKINDEKMEISELQKILLISSITLIFFYYGAWGLSFIFLIFLLSRVLIYLRLVKNTVNIIKTLSSFPYLASSFFVVVYLFYIIDEFLIDGRFIFPVLYAVTPYVWRIVYLILNKMVQR